MIRLVYNIDPSRIFLPDGADITDAGDYDLEPLKSSIAENGILTPLVIRTAGEKRKEVVCGRRRLLCARLLRLKTVPCIKIVCTDAQAAALRLSERLSVRPAGCFDVAERINELTAVHGLTVAQAAKSVGIPAAKVQSALDLLLLPQDIRLEAARYGISGKAAMLLLDLPEEERRRALENAAQADPAETIIKNYIAANKTTEKKPPLRKTAIGDIKMFSNSLEKLLYTLSNAGFDTGLDIREGERFISYEIKIKKKTDMIEKNRPAFSQMKMC